MYVCALCAVLKASCGVIDSALLVELLCLSESGPLCSCTPVNYASNVSCNITYADSTFHPIYPIVTWKLNGVFLASSTLQRTRITGNWYSQSTITNNGGDPGDYTCQLTFAAPTNIQVPYVARNAPDFSDSCSVPG